MGEIVRLFPLYSTRYLNLELVLLPIMGSINLNSPSAKQEFCGEYHLPTGNVLKSTKNVFDVAYASISHSVAALEQHFKAILGLVK